MADSTWFFDALKDISEFAKQEKIDGVLEGLAQALETYAIEVGVTVDQHDEVHRILGTGNSAIASIQDMGAVRRSQRLRTKSSRQ